MGELRILDYTGGEMNQQGWGETPVVSDGRRAQGRQGQQGQQGQLPRGVPRGVWQYAQATHIAEEYDEYFARNDLFELDEQVLLRHFSLPGLVVDLGCGTGRVLLPLARRGFRTLGVDLSAPMLQLVGEKARLEDLSIGRVRANLVELGCLGSDSVDYCICLFSTLGMVRGRENRQQVLGHVRRILKPGGLFVIHVHNFWYSLFIPPGRGWAVRQLLSSPFRRNVERGDKFFDYRGIPKMFLHTFSRSELLGALADAGFDVKELIPLNATRGRPLRFRWFFGGLRANGWIAVCEKQEGSTAGFGRTRDG